MKCIFINGHISIPNEEENIPMKAGIFQWKKGERIVICRPLAVPTHLPLRWFSHISLCRTIHPKFITAITLGLLYHFSNCTNPIPYPHSSLPFSMKPFLTTSAQWPPPPSLIGKLFSWFLFNFSCISPVSPVKIWSSKKTKVAISIISETNSTVLNHKFSCYMNHVLD